MLDINTCGQGPYLAVERDITCAGMVAMCLDLNSEFRAEGFTFEPEPITDGFIHFSNYTGDDYKCMRVDLDSTGWPWVPENVMTAWKVPAACLCSLGNRSVTRTTRRMTPR